MLFFVFLSLWENRKKYTLVSAPGSWNPGSSLTDKGARSIFYSNIWSLTPVLTHYSWNPCNFLGDRRVFCYNKANLGGLLDESWRRAAQQKKQAMIRSLEFSALSLSSPTPPLSEEGRRAEYGVNDISCLHDEASIKSQQYRVRRASRLVNTCVQGRWSTPSPCVQKFLCWEPSQTLP